jgi:hypothetical protein
LRDSENLLIDYGGGGGSSTLQYDSSADRGSVEMAGTKVLGVVEK